MTKKVIIVIVAAVLLLTVIPALAATPSKTTEDLTQVVGVVYEDGTVHNDVITVQEQLTEFDEAIITDLLTYKTKNDKIVDYFDADVKAGIQELLPQGATMDGLIMSELVCLCCGEHDDTHGTITCEYEFPTEYKDTDVVVPLLGYQDAEGKTAWLPVKGEVKNGHVVVAFTEEILTLIGHDFVLAILSK